MHSCMVRCEYLNIVWGFLKGYLRFRSFKRSSFLSDLLNFYFSDLFPFLRISCGCKMYIYFILIHAQPVALVCIANTSDCRLYFCIFQIHHEICKLQWQRRTEGRAAALSPPPLLSKSLYFCS